MVSWCSPQKANTMASLLLRNRWEVFNDLIEDEEAVLLQEEENISEDEEAVLLQEEEYITEDEEAVLLEEEENITEDEEAVLLQEEEETTAEKVFINWLELPVDVMFLIFKKLGPLHILYSAQSVCSLWRNLAKEPHQYRSIDIRNQRKNFLGVDLLKLAREAVERSCGELVEICYGNFRLDAGLCYMVDISKSLKCLRFAYCSYATDEEFIQVITKLPLLEELELYKCFFSKETIKRVVKLCPQLKYLFLFHHRYHYSCEETEYDDLAYAIAENVPRLQRLCLFQNELTNKGLQAILDGCPYLEYLDVRRCYNIDLDVNLERKIVGRIKHFRCPLDSVEDFEKYVYESDPRYEVDDYYSFGWAYSDYDSVDSDDNHEEHI